MNLKPLGDRLMVEPIEQEVLTPSGIMLPETAKEKPMQGKVLAIGPGARRENGARWPFLDVLAKYYVPVSTLREMPTALVESALMRWPLARFLLPDTSGVALFL